MLISKLKRLTLSPITAAKISAVAISIGLACGLSIAAQPQVVSSSSLLDGLRKCRDQMSEGARATCYDGSVSALLAAVEAGDIRLVDREEVRKTRRQLFGTGAPELDILKSNDPDGDDSSELLETSITSAVKTGAASWRFTTAEGAVWEIKNPPRKLAPLMPGDKVVFKKATLGFFFVRINGQIGVKGRRIS